MTIICLYLSSNKLSYKKYKFKISRVGMDCVYGLCVLTNKLRIMKIKQTCLTLTAVATLMASQFATAHSSIVEKEIVEGQRTYLTIQVPHGCGDNPTKKIAINMVQPQAGDPDDWMFTGVQPVISWYKTKTKTNDMSGEVESIRISGISVPTHYVFKAEFRGRAPLLPHGEESKTLYFDIIQKCTDNTVSEWTVENGRAASVLVVKGEDAGHH
jgi:uncharacterized protein YcnI